MAQKPYKYNIEYIQKFYSYGSEAKAVELKPVEQAPEKILVPKYEREPVTTVCIDPIAFCGVMVAIVMVVVMLAGLIRFNVISRECAQVEEYVNSLREEHVLMTHQYRAGFDLDEVEDTARALGMIPISQANTVSVQVQTPVRQPEPGFLDNVKWFLGGLFE